MSAKLLQPSTETRALYGCAGKVFLLGEYSVLDGGSALVATTGPRFRLDIPSRDLPTRFADESPAGKLLASAPLPPNFGPLDFQFGDPHLGRGGFGASSAQFVLLYLVLAEKLQWSTDWLEIWRRFRSLQSETGVLPSGADIVAQALGGVIEFKADGPSARVVESLLDWEQLMVFSATEQADRKVATHTHLAELPQNKTQGLAARLQPITDRGLQAIQENDPTALGLAMTQYAESLHDLELELPAAYEDRLVLGRLKGVLGSKGTGALLADGVIVIMSPHSSISERVDVIETAEKRGLRLVTDGVYLQAPARRER